MKLSTGILAGNFTDMSLRLFLSVMLVNRRVFVYVSVPMNDFPPHGSSDVVVVLRPQISYPRGKSGHVMFCEILCA